jgi:hypothetical protein
LVYVVDVSHIGVHIFLDIPIIIILSLYVFVFFIFFFLDMVSPILDSQDNGRRKWTPEEDIKLVQALLEHYNEGNDKQETRLQPGYFKILEVKLSRTLPNAGIKAKPHIESRLKTLKKDFQVIHAMLCGPDTSGFGWDNVRKCVVAEDAVWQAYVQVKF